MIPQKDIKTIIEGSEIIRNCILDSLRNNTGALIGRHGSTELTCIISENPIDHTQRLERYSGIFGGHVDKWLLEYTEACEKSDVFAAGWYQPLAREEIGYVKLLNPDVKLIPLRSLEPYYTDDPWSTYLKGQTVTVVSSFADTMSEQVSKDIWEKDVLPSCTWKFVRSYYCPSIANGRCEWPENIASWKDAVDYLEERVLKTNPRVVLIGCGGLAMPLALRLKKKGIIAIVLGGAIQILFGIKGFRWENHSEISKFFNYLWVFPSVDETPYSAEKIEHGCYW